MEDFLSSPHILENSLGLLPQEVVFIDSDYQILWLNRAKQKSHPELQTGMHCFEAFGFHSVCDFCLAQQAKFMEHHLKNPVCLMTGKHRNVPRHINIMISPVIGADRALKGFIEIVDNVEALYQTNSELERLNHEYENVIYALSHDLRSPLISIEGFVRKLEKALPQNDEKTAEHCTQRIHANVATMNNLVNVLLDTSRIITGALDLHENDIELLAREMADHFSARAAEQGARINVTGHFYVEICDKVRISQVYSNLIGNALKHCRDKKDLVIELGAGRHVYWVKDNGPGIPSDFQDIVFEPFTQGHTAGKESFGMGMNIVYRIIQKHAGEIWIESKEKAGTTVFFTFKGVVD
jgi:signal transduction histidine kinase